MLHIGVLGISGKSGDLKLREEVAQAVSSCSYPDKVVISTCNRTEIYFSHDDLAGAQSEVFRDLKKKLGHTSEHAFYSYFGEECFYHLACVTAGLDSALLAESDIQRQVKLSYEAARLRGRLSSSLHYLFQKSLKLAKDARSSFSLFQMATQMEGRIYQLVHSLLGNNPSLLFMGNSDINRKMIHYFSRKKMNRMTLVTRDLEAAYPFALDHGLTLKDREELAYLGHYEGVIAATIADDYLVKEMPRQFQTRLILDLSVPRSIDPKISRIPTLTLLNMQEVQDLFARDHFARHAEVQQIKKFLESSTGAYFERFRQKIVLSI